MNVSRQAIQPPKKIRKLFSPEEDALLIKIMSEQCFGSWNVVAEQIPTRTARQCRDRWINYLSPENKNGPWTAEEDRLLVEKYHIYGRQWSLIAKFFEGRSENNVKNRWYTHLQKKTPSPSVPIPNIKSSTEKAKLPPITTLDQSLASTQFMLLTTNRIHSQSCQPISTCINAN